LIDEKSNLKKPKRSEMTDEERVRDFQRKLYRKAKEDKEYRFYVLYDKVCLPHFLREAYRKVKANRGAPGVDNVNFETITKRGETKYLQAIQKELEEGVYKPDPVKRVMIPKANGKMRPLGIPTIKDRIVEMTCKLVIEPIFEADFQDSSYGFRPKRSATDAIKEIKKHLWEGREEILDADLSSYFDTIPHQKLMILIAQRISDKRMLHLIKMWLKAPISEEGKISGGKKNKVGTPQGGVISPLLANIYLNPVDKMIKKMAIIPEDIRIVRYADDFVLMGRKISERIQKKLQEVLQRMELQLNKEKTKILNASQDTFDFLGFTFHKRWSKTKRGKKYYHIQASKKSCKKIKTYIKEYLRENLTTGKTTVIKELNMKIRGWLNYFHKPGLSHMWKTADMLHEYLEETLYRYTRRKSQRCKEHYCRNAFYIWVKEYGMIDPKRFCRMTPLKA
jgi:group II intron reverse transcriptase/maturase